MYKVFTKILFIFLISNFLIFCPHTPKDIHASILFYDDFNRSDNNSLGTKWELFYGGQPAGIENNKAYIQTGAGGQWGFYKVVNLNAQDQDVSITFTHQDGDTTLLARVIDVNNRIAINYYQTGSLQIYEVYNGNYRLIPNSAPNAVIGTEYTFRTQLIGNAIKVWVNGNLYADALLNHVTSGSAGFGANDGYTKVLFDNFVVEDGNPDIPTSTPTNTPTSEPTVTETPTTIPTATPTFPPTATPTIEPTATVTATPTSNIPVLSVPSLKQYSVPWKNKIYAHTKNTIHELGCALTSATMILQYHGHIVLPDALNNWLKNQNDGYIRNGLINWLAVSRYTKIHDSTNSPTLEYKRLKPTNDNLDNELNNNRPAILKENGHFVVATGKTNETYLINDPGYSNRNTLEPYGNTYLAINSYTPTHSDLSYMMFVVDSDINVEILDSSGSAIPVQSYIDEPIKNLLKPNAKNGESVKTVLFEKPINGKYTLKVSGAKGNYQLDSYLYDTNGKLTKNKFEGSIKGNDIDTFNISFEGKMKINEKEKYKDYKHWYFKFWKYFWDRH